MGRTWLIFFGAMIGAVLLAAAFWYVDYRAGLTPELVLALPAAECGDLQHDPWWGLAYGPDVNRLCESKGIADGPFFALKGRKAVTIQPHTFHGVHGELKTADAEQDVVYVYRYRERYRPMIEAP